MSAAANEILTLTAAVAVLLAVLNVIGEIARDRQPAGQSSPVVENFLARIHSWWAIVALLGAAMLLGPWVVVLLFAMASFAALREVATYTAKTRADHISLALAFFVILPAQYVLVGLGADGLFGAFIPVYAFLLLPAVSAVRGNADRFLVRASETQWALMTAVFCISHIPALMTLEIPGFEGRGALLIVFFLMAVQGGELIDYGVGRRFGRRRIAPGLSPLTLEGALAGVAGAAAIGGILAWITPFGVLPAMAMAAVAAGAGVAGSIVLSAIKRDRGVKDWSHLIPGQGGLMDQFDGAIFAAPVFYHLTAQIWAV